MPSKTPQSVSVRLETGSVKCQPGTTLLEIFAQSGQKNGRHILLAKMDGLAVNLLQPVFKDCRVEWIDADTIEARRANQMTLCMILYRAAGECFPAKKLIIDHSLGNGLFCTWKDREHVTRKQARRIERRMRRLILSDEPVVPVTMTRAEAVRLLNEQGETVGFEESDEEIVLYQYGGNPVYTGYPVFHSARNASAFALRLWKPGLVLAIAEDHELPVFFANIYRKLCTVFREYRQWENILGIETPADINERIANGDNIDDLVKIAEALHEKRVAEIADTAARKGKGIVVFIAGPSSSGKTTFTKRLSIQLRVIGLSPIMISLDDYFLDRDRTPLGSDGKPDFESLQALDIQRFGLDLRALMRGETVRLPRYDFVAGRGVPGAEVSAPSQPILVEGLHGMNQRLTSEVPARKMLRVYVSALTQLNMTNQVRLPTSDVRLMRRMVRDSQFRGRGAEKTLNGWPSVRQGEETHIFPFQELADCMFNTSLMYELSVIRVFVEPLLEQIGRESACYSEASRLLEYVRCFHPIDMDEVPPTSILREFIGGSSFRY